MKRNFQVMPGAAWLELLCKHIPDRDEHLARYVDGYANRSRGVREWPVLAGSRHGRNRPVADTRKTRC